MTYFMELEISLINEFGDTFCVINLLLRNKNIQEEQ